MNFKSYSTCFFFFFCTLLFSQKGVGKYKYIDIRLGEISKTYLAGEFYASGFDVMYETALAINDANNKTNLVSCRNKILNSFLIRDNNETLKNTTTLGIRFEENYSFILSYKPLLASNEQSAEVSLFYLEDGVIFNYPNKNSETSISGKIIQLEPFKNGTNNFLQKISFANGGYLIVKDYFFFYAIKLNEFDCELMIKD